MLPTLCRANLSANPNCVIGHQNIAIPQQDFQPSMLQSIKIAIHDEIEPIIFPQLVNHFETKPEYPVF